MKTAILIGLAAMAGIYFMAGPTSQENTDLDFTAQFTKYIADFGRQYKDSAEYRVRFGHFTKSLKTILAHNMKNSPSFRMALNRYSDFSDEEFTATLGLRDFDQMPEDPIYNPKPESFDGAWAPVDHRSITEEVKDQGSCGSCWAFACAAVVETRWLQHTGKEVDLSEQQLCDCDRSSLHKYAGNMGCKGGRTFDCFRWYKKSFDSVHNSGAEEGEYPYTSGDGSDLLECTKRVGAQSVMTSGYSILEADNPDVLAAEIQNGPVAVSVMANQDSFKHYGGGVIDSDCADNRLDHAVVAVGIEDVRDENVGCDFAYIVRNSWGVRMGEAGHLRICPGQCGMEKLSTIPKL